MIIKFKIFENLENIHEIEVGDYVIVKRQPIYSKEYNFFLETNIFKIVEIPQRLFMKSYLDLRPLDNSAKWNHIQRFKIEDIEHFSKNKEELEHIVSAKKYNL